ncbi:uncharacterized protein METZ01_LOCUS390419, partial [marine metagenome]
LVAYCSIVKTKHTQYSILHLRWASTQTRLFTSHSTSLSDRLPPSTAEQLKITST